MSAPTPEEKNAVDAEVLVMNPEASADGVALEESEANVEDAFGKLQEELGVIHDRYLRLGAEFENFKKRSERERLTSIRFANESLVVDLLPVLDHLEQAIIAANNHSSQELNDATNHVVAGVKMVLKQFKDVLAKSGLKEFSSAGIAFNPNLHEALAERESEADEAGIVLEEFQKGYMLNDRLVRPARVVVSKRSATSGGQA